MPHFHFTLQRGDDPLIREFAYQVKDLRPPNNAHGIPLRIEDIVAEMKENIARGMIYRIETNNFGAINKMRVVDPADTEEGNDAEERTHEPNSLLGDIDGWKQGRVYDHDDDAGL